MHAWRRSVTSIVDPLADVMDLSRVRGALLGNVRAAAPWGLDAPAVRRRRFHAITSGTAWLRVEGSEPRQLMPGDLLLLPTGVAAPALLDAGRRAAGRSTAASRSAR